MMILNEGTLVTLVLGDKSYMGTLKMRTEGVQETWYIALDAGKKGEPDEIEIHKREGAVTITDTPKEAPAKPGEKCTDGQLHESIMGSEFCLKCGEPF
jgi:hypothetical protein